MSSSHPVLHFPNLQTLRLAITSKLLPTHILGQPTRGHRSEKGDLWIEFPHPLEKQTHHGLHQLNIQTGTKSPPLKEKVQTWFEWFPLQKEADPVHDERTSILFWVEDPQSLNELIFEMLRLGNDRQRFAMIIPKGRRGVGQHFLRVLGPPYFTLARAQASESLPQPITAYYQQRDRVWVPWGKQHPLGDFLRPPKNYFLLIPPQGKWELFPEVPFRDIYELTEFQLPRPAQQPAALEWEKRFQVPLKLIRHQTAEPAELWVLQENANEQLEKLVQTADDRLLERLTFAATTDDSEPILVLRARPSREKPPVLGLQAIRFRRFFNLPNLFLPIDQTISPPLRRDVVQRILATDSQSITWLHPTGDGSFQQESMPEGSFQPLRQWVDYLLEQERKPLETWQNAMQFAFEPFICNDDLTYASSEKSLSEEGSSMDLPSADFFPEEENSKSETKESEPTREQEKAPSPQPPQESSSQMLPAPDHTRQRLQTLENEYLEQDFHLSPAERIALWTEMAFLNTELKQSSDTASCWLHALWLEENLDPSQCQAWFMAEAQEHELAHEAPTPAWEDLLEKDTWTTSEARLIIALLVFLQAQATAQPGERTSWQNWLPRHVEKIQQKMEAQERTLPLRAIWLAWRAIAHFSGDDVLSLARARDRILARLHLRGVSPDLELPRFLRVSGTQSSDRLRQVGQHLEALRDQIQTWIEDSEEEALINPNEEAREATQAYADYIFAFGAATLHRTGLADECLESALVRLPSNDAVHDCLRESFEYRIQQRLQGDSPRDRLPPSIQEKLELLTSDQFFIYDKWRHHSRILEPNEQPDRFRRHLDEDLVHRLARLSDLQDREEVLEGIQPYLEPATFEQAQLADQVTILKTALELSLRLGESFARESLSRLRETYHTIQQNLKSIFWKISIEQEIQLIERAFITAGHYNLSQEIEIWIAHFRAILKKDFDNQSLKAISTLFTHGLKSLNKVGMRQEMNQLLEETSQRAERWLRQAQADTPENPETKAEQLQFQLQLTAAHAMLAPEETSFEGNTIIHETRSLLFSQRLKTKSKLALACCYVEVLSQASLEQILPLLEEIFQQLQGLAYDLSINKDHYCYPQLKFIETVVLLFVSDELTLDRKVQQRLEQEEYELRRRIHREMEQALQSM
ncbi:Hypothetical protein PBC10988_17440 [Planctomycetales bacterium 10988]|nr:Hypothetical protein PBC10988_17440 [Planctomycetales bacterium 10988]